MAQKKKTTIDIDIAIQNWLDQNAGHKKATMKDVADIAGVSKNTISRIINNSPLVKEKTRENVKKIIHKIGYKPDPQARGLAFRHSFLIGMIYGNPNPQYVLNLQRGILDGLNDTDYELVVHPCDSSTPDFLENARHFIERMKLTGVILTPPLAENEDFAEILRDIGCNYVRIAPVQLDEEKHMLVTHDKQGARAAAFYLAALGHTKIGFIAGRNDFLTGTERHAGFIEGLAANDLHLPTEYFAQGDFTFDSGTEAANTLLSLPNPPTAIFAANDEMAAGALLAIRLAGLRAPDSVSVIGFDNFHIAQTVWPRLTTLHSPTREIGKLAAERILNADSEEGLQFPEIPAPQLVIRETTAPPNQTE